MSPLNTPGACRGRGVRGSQIKKSWEAVKRLDRLAPDLAHIYGFISEWTWLKTFGPTIPQGDILGGFMGSTSQKTGKCGQTAGPIKIQFCVYNADESGNGHRLNTLAT